MKAGALLLFPFLFCLPVALQAKELDPERSIFIERQMLRAKPLQETEKRSAWKTIVEFYSQQPDSISADLFDELIRQLSFEPCPEFFQAVRPMVLNRKVDSRTLEVNALKNYSEETFNSLIILYYGDRELRAKRLYLHGSLEGDKIDGNEKDLLFYAALLAEIYAAHTGATTLEDYQRPIFFDSLSKMTDGEILRRSITLILYPNYEQGKKPFTVEDDWHVSSTLAESGDRVGTARLSAVGQEPSLDRSLESVLSALAVYHRLTSDQVDPVYWGRIAGDFRFRIVRTLTKAAIEQTQDPVGKATIQISRYAIRYFEPALVRANESEKWPSLKGLPNPPFSCRTLEGCLSARPRTRQESQAQNEAARTYLASLMGTPSLWKSISIQSLLESLKVPQMGNLEKASGKPSLEYTLEAKGSLVVEGTFQINGNQYVLHSIPLRASLLMSPSQSFPEAKPEDLHLDDTYRCLNWQGGKEKFAGLCFSAFKESSEHAVLQTPVYRFGARYRAWKPEGKSPNVPRFEIGVSLTPKQGTHWVVARISHPKDYLVPKCVGCVSPRLDLPVAHEQLSGWYLFSVFPEKPIDLLGVVEPEFQTDLVAKALDPAIAAQAKDMSGYLEVIELSSEALGHLGKTDIFNLAQSDADYPLLRYVANLPMEDRSDLSTQERVIQRLATLKKMTDLALGEDLEGGAVANAPVQERRKALAIGIALEAARCHTRYSPQLAREILRFDEELRNLQLGDGTPATKLEATNTKKRILALCLALEALRYESAQGGPVAPTKPLPEAERVCLALGK
jgi:hypothetical protein